MIIINNLPCEFGAWTEAGGDEEERIESRPVDVETVETNPGLLYGSSVRYVLSHHLCVSDYPIFNFKEEVGLTGCHMEA